MKNRKSFVNVIVPGTPAFKAASGATLQRIEWIEEGEETGCPYTLRRECVLALRIHRTDDRWWFYEEFYSLELRRQDCHLTEEARCYKEFKWPVKGHTIRSLDPDRSQLMLATSIEAWE